jgi:ribosome-binding factor A
MESKRQQKFAGVIQKDLAEIFQREVLNFLPNIMVTITKVRVSPDLAIARVYLSFFNSTNNSLTTQREVKTHRAACAIDDFIDDSKQALSMISWMAAQREGRKTRTQTGLRLHLFTLSIPTKFAKGF